MSMIAQGNPAVGKAAVEFLSRHPKECAVAESDRQDGQGRILVQTVFFDERRGWQYWLDDHVVWPQSCSTGTLPFTFLAECRSCVDSLPRWSLSTTFSRIGPEKTLLLQRMSLPVQLTESRCEGYRTHLDAFGHHRAACARSGKGEEARCLHGANFGPHPPRGRGDCQEEHVCARHERRCWRRGRTADGSLGPKPLLSRRGAVHFVHHISKRVELRRRGARTRCKRRRGSVSEHKDS